MSAPNPVSQTFPASNPTISATQHTIAGILVTVYGLVELVSTAKNVSCLWLLHPRLQTQACMQPIAAAAITRWNERNTLKDTGRGLIAVTFDQRNHGSRQVSKIANEDWRSGNERHAVDMFSSFNGTTLDTFQLMTYLSSYIFPGSSARPIDDHLVLGISLGGHAAWQCVLHDRRISTAIAVIGCPDYARLISDRARLSKRKTWTATEPQGKSFMGSEDFPQGLMDAVNTYDPAGLFLGDGATSSTSEHLKVDAEKEGVVRERMQRTLQGKRLLCLSGGADKLVPYKCAEPFLQWLKGAISNTGIFRDGDFVLKDLVFDGVGHATSKEMLEEALGFIMEALENGPSTATNTSSKL